MRHRTLIAGLMLLATVESAFAAPRVLSILTAQDSETQAMSLILANQMQATGAQVEMLLCGSAGDVVTKTPPAAATAPVTPQGFSVRVLAERFMAQGGKIAVCAIYLPNRKATPDTLMTGVQVAQPKDVASTMLDPAVKVVGN